MSGTDRDANPRENTLLAGLPDEVRRRLLPDLKPVAFELGQTLYRPNQRLLHVYFPLDALVSKIYTSAEGETSGIGVIGREGIVGMSSFMSGGETPAETVAIKAGHALRLGTQAFAREFERGGAFQQILLRFTQAFIAQMGQIAVCNRHHSVEQQLCRWLLFYLDRASSCELQVTHDLIARLLGVRREGVTRAALKLKREGLLAYKRGFITVLDRARMESSACECYRVVHDTYETLLAPSRAKTHSEKPLRFVG